MNLGHETETIEFKRSTSEMREGMESIASILNKHGHGELYFGVRSDGEVVGQDISEKTLRDACDEVGVRISYERVPIGTKFVFHRNDAFAPENGRDVADNDETINETMANNGRQWPIDETISETKTPESAQTKMISETMADNGRQKADKMSVRQLSGLSSVEKDVLSCLEECGESTTQVISKVVGASERTTRRTLAKLVELGLVAAAGANKNRTYYISGQVSD